MLLLYYRLLYISWLLYSQYFSHCTLWPSSGTFFLLSNLLEVLNLIFYLYHGVDYSTVHTLGVSHISHFYLFNSYWNQDNVRGMSEKIRRIYSPYNVRTIFRNSTTLWRHLFQVKSPIEKNKTKVCIYSITCICDREYKGETWHSLKVRLKGYQKAVVKGETTKSGVADHIWREKGGHQPLLNEVKII